MVEIKVIPYDPTWPQQYETAAQALVGLVDAYITRVDHIGSTSVPGMAAKDIIDILLSVESFSDEMVRILQEAGYVYHPNLGDQRPVYMPDVDPMEWTKQVFTNPPDQRRLNIHVRPEGAANQRHALLYRDYLREHPVARDSIGRLKMSLARRHPHDRDFYYEIKDPAYDIMWEAALEWAEHTNWQP